MALQHDNKFLTRLVLLIKLIDGGMCDQQIVQIRLRMKRVNSAAAIRLWHNALISV